MIPIFKDIEDINRFLRNELHNDKSRFFREKKMMLKKADGFNAQIQSAPNQNAFADKSASISLITDPTELQVKAIINTTNVIDSHRDLHLPKLWNKSLKDPKPRFLLNNHDRSFESVITRSINAYAKTYSWKDLGYSFNGNTEALVYDSQIKLNKYNELLFDAYKNLEVTNHSVGMQYVNILLCVDSDEKYWIEEKDNFDKYKEDVANTDEIGNYFWAVLEAKEIEGSAVLIGSNQYTPTYTTEELKTIEPGQSTQSTNKQEPGQSTLQEDLNKFYNHLNFIKR